MKLTRRDFFKGVGAGTALAGLSGMARPAPAAAKTAARSTAAPHAAGDGIRAAGTFADRRESQTRWPPRRWRSPRTWSR